MQYLSPAFIENILCKEHQSSGYCPWVKWWNSDLFTFAFKLQINKATSLYQVLLFTWFQLSLCLCSWVILSQLVCWAKKNKTNHVTSHALASPLQFSRAPRKHQRQTWTPKREMKYHQHWGPVTMRRKEPNQKVSTKKNAMYMSSLEKQTSHTNKHVKCIIQYNLSWNLKDVLPKWP